MYGFPSTTDAIISVTRFIFMQRATTTAYTPGYVRHSSGYAIHAPLSNFERPKNKTKKTLLRFVTSNGQNKNKNVTFRFDDSFSCNRHKRTNMVRFLPPIPSIPLLLLPVFLHSDRSKIKFPSFCSAERHQQVSPGGKGLSWGEGAEQEQGVVGGGTRPQASTKTAIFLFKCWESKQMP